MKIIRILCVLLCVLSLCACKDTQVDEHKHTGAETSTEISTALPVVQNGESRYTIIRSDIDRSMTEASVALRRYIEDATGCRLALATDWKDTPITEYEILIGKTNREGSVYDAYDLSSLGDTGYLIAAVGNRILITGNSASGIEAGCQAFAEQYLTEEGLSVPQDLYLYVEPDWPIGSLIIAGNEIDAFSIVIGETASEVTRYAADELQKYLASATGVTLPILDKAETPSIRLLEADFPNIETFSIKTENADLVIQGKERGLLYGTYEFLEKYVGWHFLTTDCDFIDARESVVLSDIDDTITPYFTFRDTFWRCYQKPDIAVKRRANSLWDRKLSGIYGGGIGYTGGGVHTMQTLAGCNKWKQPCLSDPQVYDTVLSNVLALLAENPDARLISVSQNDNHNYCTCKDCAAVDEAEGSHAGTLIRFVNRIAEAVEKDYPNVMIHTLAYQYSRTPPKMTKPRSNVIIQLCSIDCCFNHALNDPSCPLNASFQEDMHAWTAVCDNIFVWDYVTNFHCYITPFPNFDVLRENMRYFAENGIKGLFSQGNNRVGNNGEFGELRAYLISRLMANPYMTEEEYNAEINIFLRGFYGPGWESIRSYIDFMTACGDRQDHFTINGKARDVLYLPDYQEKLTELEALFDQAEELAETEAQVARIARARISFTYAKLCASYDSIHASGDADAIAALKKEAEDLVSTMIREKISLRTAKEFPTKEDLDINPIEW